MSIDDHSILWHRNIAENFNCLSRVHECYRQTTDGRTMTWTWVHVRYKWHLLMVSKLVICVCVCESSQVCQYLMTTLNQQTQGQRCHIQGHRHLTLLLVTCLLSATSRQQLAKNIYCGRWWTGLLHGRGHRHSACTVYWLAESLDWQERSPQTLRSSDCCISR